MMVQLYIKRRTPQSNWMRSRKTLVPFHSRQSNCLLVIFFLLFFLSFFPSTAPALAVGNWRQKPHSLFIVSVSLQTLNSWPPSAVRPRSSQQNGIFFFFLLVLVLVLRTRCQLQWGMSSVGFVQSMELSVRVAASLRPSQWTISVTLFFRKPLKRLRSIKLQLFLKKQFGKKRSIFYYYFYHHCEIPRH